MIHTLHDNHMVEKLHWSQLYTHKHSIESKNTKQK